MYNTGMSKYLAILIVFLTLGAAVYFFGGEITPLFFKPRTSLNDDHVGVSEETLNKDNSETASDNSPIEPVKVIAQDLEIPWEIAFINAHEMLVTERPGKLIKVTLGGDKTTVSEIRGVRHVGEGGLLGLVLHPDFSHNNKLYLYLTTNEGGGLTNRVESYTLQGETLVDREVLLDGIAGASNHDGGRMKFGPDGKLYITTGDAETGQSAQDTNSLNGKILRMNDNGSVPNDNPFGNYVYSYGHRNPQGLAWDSQGRLWSTEHGPSGLQSGYDELNLIEPGKNYGWPDIRGNQTGEGMETARIQSGGSDTWAPAGAVYYDGSIFFGGLRGETLYEAVLKGTEIAELRRHYSGEFGRIRAVVLGPDGLLYITTSNTDGRGRPNSGDDKIIRIDPSKLQ